jgi:NADP-dependent 3-hydroxy acid dehydrogenase YdfG
MSGIKDKVVAITSASSGIGESTARLLSERAAKLVLGARRSDRLEALADRVTKAGGLCNHRRKTARRLIQPRQAGL